MISPETIVDSIREQVENYDGDRQALLSSLVELCAEEWESELDDLIFADSEIDDEDIDDLDLDQDSDIEEQ